MLGVALDRLDQVRDEVIPPLELDIDLRPAILTSVPQDDQAVVDADRRDDHDTDDDQQND